ncbi:glycosyltransferase [Butyrivibrio sp. XBB1001]|uniref:glycosyltransferase n=1 Tax=Butyrivibrio sp. XBB1001 TaxID=1280682 RepID=UPI0004084D5E|nr:glycosyltransferase [Butyrivibrio sp. XBB1001]
MEMVEETIPVLITTCNRYQHLAKCLEALGTCKYADKTKVYIAVDYPPSQDYIVGYNKTRELLDELVNNNPFFEMIVIYRSTNLGPNNNAQQLIEYAEKKYKAFIRMEDDIVVAPAFLDYCYSLVGDAGNNIFAVCGYVSKNLPVEKIESNFLMRGCNTWGTVYFTEKMRDIERWRSSDKVIKFCLNPMKMLKLRFYSIGAFNIIVMGMLVGKTKTLFDNGIIPALTDVIICMYMIEMNYYAICPAQNLVENIGLDGSGQNSRVGDETNFIRDYSKDYKFTNVSKRVLRSKGDKNVHDFIFNKIVCLNYFRWLLLSRKFKV